MSQITMKDLAQHFGVSLSTIHKAIAGKPGVSEATRKKIVDYANENGYKLNAIAAYLKKKAVNIAVCLPALDKENAYFYDFVWQGYRRLMKEWRDLNIKIFEYPYRKDALSETLLNLDNYSNGDNMIHGLLTVAPWDDIGIKAINSLSSKGVSVVFVTGDNQECKVYGTVGGDFYSAGLLMAEQISNILKPESRVLLIAGDPYISPHYLVTKGFEDFIRKYDVNISVKNLYGYGETTDLEKNITSYLRNEIPDGICCVFAKGSAALYKALKVTELAGKIPVIGSDIFDESVAGLKEGVFTNLIFKDPYKQGYLGAQMLCEYLIKDIIPQKKHKKVETIIIFKSNVNNYWNKSKQINNL